MNNMLKHTSVVVFLVAAFLIPAVFSPFLFAETISATTNNATSIGENSAVLNGFVSNPGGRSTVYFEWSGGPSTSPEEYNGNVIFRATVSGLIPGRSYSFRAIAISNTTGERVVGATLDFTSGQKQYPSQQIPTVETRSASNVTNISVVLIGAVNPQGSSDTVRWFEWGTTQSLGNQTPKSNQGTSAGDFSHSLSDLKSNTTYYYRAVAQNANGPALGSIFSFRTVDPNYLPTTPVAGASPVVITQLPSGITTTEATLNGLALPAGAIATRGWFEWGTTMNLGNITVAQDIGSASSIPFSQKIPNLSPGTSYYFRAVIQNERGKAQGNILRLVADSSVAVVSSPVPTGEGPKEEPKASPEKPATTTKIATSTAAVGIFQKCLPNSLVGWLLLILLVILIVIAADHIVDRYQKRKEEKKRHELDMNKVGSGEGGPRVIK